MRVRHLGFTLLIVAALLAWPLGCEPNNTSPGTITDDQTDNRDDSSAVDDEPENADDTQNTTDDNLQDGDTDMNLSIASTAFGEGEAIPLRYTGDGDDLSPALAFSNIPTGTAELALICDDPDAPTDDPWVHWVIYKIPATTSGLPENIDKTNAPADPAGAVQGKNSWDNIGYGGPAPPPGHGTHHYYFKLYALDTALGAGAGLTKDELLSAMEGHILAQAELIGTYERS